jgi:hypothetical protein
MRVDIIVLSLALSWALSGCGTTRPAGEPIAAMPSAALPDYAIGDVFVFEQGYVERVVAVRKEEVDWEAAGGRLRYTAQRNFALPRLRWETPEAAGDVTLNIAADVMWPLASGNKAYMSTRHVFKDTVHHWEQPFDQVWNCRVGAAERLTVPAGTFDTFPVECRRSTFLWGSWMQTLRWHYAPAIGHYVRYYDETAGTRQRPYKVTVRDLVAYIPSLGGASKAQAQLAEMHFQEALEYLPSGQASEWHSDDDRHGRRITIKRSFVSEDGRICRDFESVLRNDGRERTHQATACRDKSAWRYALARDRLATDKKR